MRSFQVILTFVFLSIFSLGNISAQAANDLTAKVNKETGKIEVINKQDNGLVSASYKVNIIELDIFDKKGEYSGSLELKDFTFPKDEFGADEKVKVARMELVNVATGETITLKDIQLLP
ncbi:MAG: hypothetical protein GY810_07945 [Aureispira sp.]|nr:hypothetical protein [Aureispira sp.]